MFKKYQRTNGAEMRPYVSGEDMTNISVSGVDTPEEGGMVARNPENHNDQWYVAEQYFLDNFAVNESHLNVHIRQDSLSTSKYTYVSHEDGFESNAPHHFVVESEGRTLCKVDFQCGPIKESGINGVVNEDLLNMVRARLEGFQNSEYACRENAIALTKLEEALLWLRKRTTDREIRGVEGTHKV